MTDTSRRFLVEVENLTVGFETHENKIVAVEDVSFSIPVGGSVALLGESGSGKTATARAIMGLLDDNALVGGSIKYDSRELVGLPDEELRSIRGTDFSMVFQDAQSALNPAYTVGWQVAEIFRKRAKQGRREAWRQAINALRDVGIPEPERRAKQYPHQFSGGMRQRVLIAMALALNPRLLIADEPTTALDATIQAQILELIKSVHKQTGSALLLISHDLGVVAEMVEAVVVMKNGTVVEAGPVAEIYANPRHAYTRELIAASPAFQAGARVLKQG